MTTPVPMCELCRRPVAWHGRRVRHKRPCGPSSGTGAGAMTAAERARYVRSHDRSG